MAKRKLNPKVQEVLDLKNQYDAKLKDLGDEILKELIVPILKDHNLHSLKFHGYTPGFNDGDACTYSLSDDISYQFSKDGEFYGGYDSETEPEEEEIPKGFNKDKLDADLCDLYSDLDAIEDYLERNHNNEEITITVKGKMETEYYDCGH